MTLNDLRAAGIDVSPAVRDRLAAFVRLLLAENERVNLTAIRAAPEAWVLHICDSLAVLPLLRRSLEVEKDGAEAAGRAGLRLLDLGSGGGVPGIPLACVVPEVEVTLLDATRKKVAAVERIIGELGLPNAAGAWGRAELKAHEPEFRERFDVVCARAVARLPVLLEFAAGFVRPGGECWLYKSAAAAEGERAAAESAARICRLSYSGLHTYRLPGEADDRAILIYQKRANLPEHLPRPGQAGKPHR
ncbi:MAG: 16S rRNA (guanine(527)-N(7))-methyltransferase RsmG [Planctomycetota bacterium]